jgi:broad specificity phosphatase PhoE
MIKRVILIRPAETEWNRLGRFQGWVAIPLNAHGREQAQALAKYTRNIGISALYTSDLKRAVQTAELLTEHLNFAPIVDARLRERNIGNWQGMTMVEMRTWYPDEYQQLMGDRMGYRVPGGESLQDTLARVRKAFDDIQKKDKGETVGIILHTTATQILLSELISDYDIGQENFDNTAVTTIVRDGSDTWTLVAANDTLHLEGLAASAVKELE